MKEKTNTTSTVEASTIEQSLVNTYIMQDLRASLLIGSLLVNLIILTAWIAIQVTTTYDSAIVGLLFNR